MYTILLKTEKQVRTGKTTFKTVEINSEVITEKQYKNITGSDTLKWFRNLGGTETAQREYTMRGYNITKLVSTSPDKENRTIRTFEFNN